jgi:prevent-host-death family protein
MKSVTISKSKLKPRVLEILREVEESRSEVIVTDRGRPVVKILPFVDKPNEVLRSLKGSVLKYTDPTEPIEVDWNVIP